MHKFVGLKDIYLRRVAVRRSGMPPFGIKAPVAELEVNLSGTIMSGVGTFHYFTSARCKAVAQGKQRAITARWFRTGAFLTLFTEVFRKNNITEIYIYHRIVPIISKKMDIASLLNQGCGVSHTECSTRIHTGDAGPLCLDKSHVSLDSCLDIASKHDARFEHCCI